MPEGHHAARPPGSGPCQRLDPTTLRRGWDHNSRRSPTCGLHTEGMEVLVLRDAQRFAELASPWMATDPYSTNVIGVHLATTCAGKQPLSGRRHLGCGPRGWRSRRGGDAHASPQSLSTSIEIGPSLPDCPERSPETAARCQG